MSVKPFFTQDKHKGPHQMFRTLLSSVPSTTFTLGRKIRPFLPTFPRNSSITTSSHVSSEASANVALDNAVVECDQANLNSG